jgi:hypothetical protein
MALTSALRFWRRREPSKDGLHRKISKTLLSRAKKAADRNRNLVIVFCNTPYARILDNWLVTVRRLGNVPLLICAMDEGLAGTLRAAGHTVAYTPVGGRASNIWKLRVAVISRLVEAGFNVLHSDADAVWRDDPRSLFANLDADIVASQGTTWPTSTLQKWGHVCCFGFILFRATPKTRSLLRELVGLALSQDDFDDQKELNELIAREDLVWDASERYRLSYDGADFECSKQIMRGSSSRNDHQGMTIAILPHRLVQRLSNELEPAHERVVVHALSHKSHTSAESVLKAEGVWFLA